jgi:hypothetical protein
MERGKEEPRTDSENQANQNTGILVSTPSTVAVMRICRYNGLMIRQGSILTEGHYAF